MAPPGIRRAAAARRPVAALALAGLLAVLPGAGGAVEWSLGGNVGQTLAFDTNDNVSADGGEPSFNARTRLGIGLTATTPTTTWRTSQGLTLSFDSNREETFVVSDVLQPNFNGSVSHRWTGFTFGANARFRRRSTDQIRVIEVLGEDDDFDPLDPEDEPIVDLLRVEDETIQTNFGGGVNVSFAASRRNTLNAGLSANVLRLADEVPNRSPSERLTFNLGWRHLLDATSTTGLTFNASRFTSDNALTGESNENLGASLVGVYDVRLSPVLSISSTLGGRISDTSETDVTNGIAVDRQNLSFGFVGSLGANLQLPGVRVGLRLSQDSQPNSDGEVRNVTRLSANATRQFTRRTSLQTSFGYSRRTGLSGSGDDTVQQRFRLRASLSYRLSQSWRSSLDYTLSAEDDAAGLGVSNRIGVSLSRRFSVF